MHTPGPWTVKRTPSGINYRRGVDAIEVFGSPGYVASVGPKGASDLPRAEANARLIAAAPEMLALLTECADGNVTKAPNFFGRVRAILAKLEGR